MLLDGGDLSGSFFHRTVVLICDHNAEGAFGLVLNRSAGNKVGEVLVADLPDTLQESPLFLGGPVQPTALSFLHSDNFIPDANVFPNLASAIRSTIWSKSANRFRRRKKSSCSPVTPAGRPASSKWK